MTCVSSLVCMIQTISAFALFFKRLFQYTVRPVRIFPIFSPCAQAQLKAEFQILGTKTKDTKIVAIKQRVSALLGIAVAPIDDLMSLRYLWTPGTCDGILSDPDYQKWMSNLEISNLLWINAEPGSGKSVLAAFLISRFLESSMRCHYYFFKHDNSGKRSASSLLRSLAFQISQDVPEFEAALDNMSKMGVRLEKLEARQIWHKLFVSVLFKLENNLPLYWVIDALDESESVNTIIELLSSLGYSKIPIHIILFSRSTSSITRALDRISNIIPVAVTSLVQNVSDIRFHTTKEIEYMHGAADLQQEIIGQIVDRAEGNFLWVSLVLREIMECHSYEEIKVVMEEIPSGMDLLYRRMEAIIKELSRASDKNLARHVLIWVMYSRRPLDIDELLQALQLKTSAILDLRFTIKKICGHFVTVDSKNYVTLVHRTAREYLIKSSNLPFSVALHDSHKEIFIRTFSVYLDPQLRSKLYGNSLPPFHSYSATSWAYHLSSSPVDSEDILDMLITFFKGPYVLPWVHSVAILGQLKVLISTSQILTSFVFRRRKIDAARMLLPQRVLDLQLLELWAVDLLKIVGKFGGHLLQVPSTIYKCITQFCPRKSALFQQFSRSTINPLSVSGLSNMEWDDCLAKISVGGDNQALLINSSDRYVAVSSSNGAICIWNSLTFEKIFTLFHQEHIFSMCFSDNGDMLASYGHLTTQIWEVSTGRQLSKVPNIADSRALCMDFANNDTALIMGSEFRKIKKLFLSELDKGWQLASISTMPEDTTLKGTFKNSPTAMAFDFEAARVAIAYRGSPMTVWALEKPECINKCRRRLGRDKHPSYSWAGVNRISWHPSSGEILGIYTDGAIFKWHPIDESHYELETDTKSTPSEIECSRDGRVFATSDVNGTIRLYDYQHSALIYQLHSEDVVTALCFSPDTRRFYDLRGSYCNAWEPNALLRTSNADEEAANTDDDTNTKVGNTFPASEAWTESHAPVTALSARWDGSVICVGNDEGNVELYDTNNDKKLAVGKSALEMSIDHLAWAKDGKTFAYGELGGKVVIKSLLKSNDENGKFGWNCETMASFKSNLQPGGIAQIMLSPNSNFLLIASSSFVELWCIDTKSVHTVQSLPFSEAGHRWITHPTNDDHFLAFSLDTITEYRWSDLQQLSKCQINLTQGNDVSDKAVIDMPGIPRKKSSGDAITHFEAEYRIEQIVATPASDYILIHTSQQSLNLIRKSQIQIINVSSLSDAKNETLQSLPTISTPPDISQAFEKALGILGKDLLVFLDKSFWVCTYQIQANIETEHVKPKRHFFLPRDWINAESLDLCQALADGAVVCPRKGEVAVIRSDLASGW